MRKYKYSRNTYVKKYMIYIIYVYNFHTYVKDMMFSSIPTTCDHPPSFIIFSAINPNLTWIFQLGMFDCQRVTQKIIPKGSHVQKSIHGVPMHFMEIQSGSDLSNRYMAMEHAIHHCFRFFQKDLICSIVFRLLQIKYVYF